MKLLCEKVFYLIMEDEMFKKYILFITLFCFSFGVVLQLHAQEPEEEGFIIEEEVQKDLQFENQRDFQFKIQEDYQSDKEEQIEEEEILAQFIIADVLTSDTVKPAINYYIHSDIKRKFTGLIANLKLEKIYGVNQDRKTATVYFDYSYTSVRNRDNIIMDKGKITFMKFNSGKWFNEELSIYLMDKYAPLKRLTPEPMQMEEQ